MEEDLYETYMAHLQTSHIHAQKALDTLYKPGAPKRGLYCRMMLGRAQSILIGLYVLELRRATNEERRTRG